MREGQVCYVCLNSMLDGSQQCHYLVLIMGDLQQATHQDDKVFPAEHCFKPKVILSKYLAATIGSTPITAAHWSYYNKTLVSSELYIVDTFLLQPSRHFLNAKNLTLMIFRLFFMRSSSTFAKQHIWSCISWRDCTRSDF